jgi:cation transport ATPase
MDPVTIAALVLGAEQAIAGIIKIVQNAGLSADDTQTYIDRITAAAAAVPEPKVG